MAAPTTSTEFLELLRKSELLQTDAYEAFVQQVERISPKSSPRDLAAQLVAAGLVTHFQAEQFLQGKWKGFTIGKYKVLERIGAGGMGTVYLCEHTVVGRKVAVKVLPTSQSDNPIARARFYREARAAGVLNHPNLVKAHDVDEENGVHFLVMDYVDGSSLQAIVARFGPLSVSRAVNYIRQAAIGLQAAHDAGLIHRDVKPANIMLERNGTIRVLDLGLARFYEDNADLLTLKYDENNVLGTADYVAPEQAVDSHAVDIRADIYSLGSTFYFLLTGQTPFPTGRISQKLVWLQVRQPTSIRELRPEVPSGIVAIVEKMMAKTPEERFNVPAEVAAALTPYMGADVALPAEEEMPRLSLAARVAGVGSGSGSKANTPGYPRPTRKSPQGAGYRPDRQLNNPVLLLDRASTTPDPNTAMATTQATPGPGHGAKPIAPRPSQLSSPSPPAMPVPPVTPSRLAQTEQSPRSLAREVRDQFSPEPPSMWNSWMIRAGLLILLGGSVGVAFSWILSRF